MPERETHQLIIVLPLYNDWTSLYTLIGNVDKLFEGQRPLFLVVNDGSTIEDVRAESTNLNLKIIHLTRNIGHQKAIAVGIAYAADNFEFNHLAVMDSDGEDQPKDVLRLLQVARENPGHVVFAKRVKRKEGPVFKFFYRIYKFLFRILTGIPISFGNFSVLPKAVAVKVVHVTDIWNHFSGGIIKSRIPYTLVPTERGKRIDGESKMNFTSLILHGLGALSVHIETVTVRILLTSITFLALSLLAIFVVMGVRLFTDLAIPGWTSNMVIGLSLVFLQSIFFSFVLIFIILSYRTQKHFLPATDYKIFIRTVL